MIFLTKKKWNEVEAHIKRSNDELGAVQAAIERMEERFQEFVDKYHERHEALRVTVAKACADVEWVKKLQWQIIVVILASITSIVLQALKDFHVIP